MRKTIHERRNSAATAAVEDYLKECRKYGKTYLLRDIPEETWRKFQSLLALEGRSKKEFFLTKINEYVNQERG